MGRIVSLYGIIAGLIVAVPMIVFMVFVSPSHQMQDGALYGYVVMIVALSTVFLGIKHYRDKELGGAIKFGRALLVGLGVSALASVLYVIAWEISLAFSDFDFAAAYSKMTIEAARAEGGVVRGDRAGHSTGAVVREDVRESSLSIADHVRRDLSDRGHHLLDLRGGVAQQSRVAGP